MPRLPEALVENRQIIRVLDQPGVACIVFRHQYDDLACYAHGLCWLRESRHGNKKRGTLAGFRFNPDLPLLAFENSLRDRQANAPWQRLRPNVLLFLQLLFLLLVVFALVRPYVWTDAASGDHLIVVLDTSASMQATDVAPNRLAEAAREAAAWACTCAVEVVTKSVSALVTVMVLAPGLLARPRSMIHSGVLLFPAACSMLTELCVRLIESDFVTSAAATLIGKTTVPAPAVAAGPFTRRETNREGSTSWVTRCRRTGAPRGGDARAHEALHTDNANGFVAGNNRHAEE